MPRLIGVGDNTVDTYVRQRMLYPGGNALNVAVLAHRYGLEVGYLGWLGKDERGALILDALRQEGIDASRCRVVEGAATGYSNVSLVGGDRVFGESDPGACRLIELDDEDLEYISGFDIVHTSVYSFLEGQIERLGQASRCLSFDLSQSLKPAYLERVLPHVDIVFASLADVTPAEQEALMVRMHAMGPSLIVMTRGKEGAWVYDGEHVLHQGIVPVEVVDTLGAGDAFAARFLAEYAAGASLAQVVERATHSAAENCMHYGAFGHGRPY